MTSDRAGVFGGVDTHKQVHVAAAVDAAGRLLATAEFDAAPDGYGELAGWLQSWGAVCRVGVEGTGSYGAGLARHLAAAGVEVVEVNRPNRQTRRRRGKSDTVDAEAAARAALSGEAAAVPKSADGLRGGDPHPQRGSPLRRQGPHGCRQPDRRCRGDRPRTGQRPPERTQHARDDQDLCPVAHRRRRRSCRRCGQTSTAGTGSPPPGAHRGDRRTRRRAASAVRAGQPGTARRLRRRR